MSRVLKVNSSRNSQCGSATLASLDWTNWYTDPSFGRHYLHVKGKDSDDESWHRVICRRAETPRLRMLDGALHWIVADESDTKEQP